MRQYGIKPTLIGNYPIKSEEMMFYMYLPIKLKGNMDIQLPKQLEIYRPLLDAVIATEGTINLKDKYVYITAKYLYVTPDNPGNRPGWHSDGFLTNDINYVWCDNHPTDFVSQTLNITEDHNKSLEEFEDQIKEENVFQYPENSLLRLDPSVIHRVPLITDSGMRSFVKISISDEEYNLVGNAHNYQLNYKWKMFTRQEVRNHPTYKNSDYIPDFKEYTYKTIGSYNIPNGKYLGTWGGNNIRLRALNIIDVKTEKGVKGINIPIQALVIDGIIQFINK